MPTDEPVNLGAPPAPTAEPVVAEAEEVSTVEPVVAEAAPIDTSPKVQANGRYPEGGPDHGDLPPDPTMASPEIHARVAEVLADQA